ncbi:MAG: hypothetical protein GTN67_12570 [Hydrotalea flava]|nr:hypothetical protein [Hydrotalea flava]NIM39007.1 hypothetical protein [Hydrotalea flava]NIN04196.1 hypothetical protein [Hydrotalea flava]NIN15869.1 hypothetical protein [Hydrotalea flava]NIO94933.1 hypothetical protein [Hydrotalea flava]
MPIDISIGGNNMEIQETEFKNKKTADSLINQMKVVPKEVVLTNTSSSKSKTFTVKITTLTNDDTTSNTLLYTLFPGEQRKIGCTHFGYILLDNHDLNNSTRSSGVQIGQKKFEIVAEFIKK